MRTVKEVSKLTGVSIRALHHYDAIGLLRPAQTTESGYRLYDDKAIERLQMILLFRELKFPLKEIKRILDSPSFDRAKALEQQLQLLILQKEHIENLIDLARELRETGVKNMISFDAFDTEKIEEYTRQAKEAWGDTAAYREYEEKAKLRTPGEQKGINDEMLEIFREFGAMRTFQAQDEKVRTQVCRLQEFITDHFYDCTDDILKSLGEMYAADGRFKETIDRAGGEGTAEFVKKSIEAYLL